MAWSYLAGEKGVNRVRAYEDPVRGRLMLEWSEKVVRPDGTVITKRPRLQLDHTDKRRAENQARALADSRAAGGTGAVHAILDDYIREVTPTKKQSKRGHDHRAARLFKMFLPATQLADRMDRTQWDGFIAARRAGVPLKMAPVGERQIQYDLKFMIAVLGWAVGTGRLQRHPWGPDIRRTQQWKMPKNKTPLRRAMTDEIRALLIKNSTSWRFKLALELGRATISRNASVRELAWVDVDLRAAEVTWRNEKDGGTYTTPLSSAAVEMLRNAPSRGIGLAYVFPRDKDSARPCSRHYFQQCLKRAKKLVLCRITDIEERERMRAKLKGVGFHSEKRSAIRNPKFRELPPKMREQLARTSIKTQNDVYDEVGLDEMRVAVERIAN
jgi:hypothetical protein